MFNWINSCFLHDRMIQVRIRSTLSDNFELENGTPQASIISLILVLVAINDLKPIGVNVSMFADETAKWNMGPWAFVRIGQRLMCVGCTRKQYEYETIRAILM